jgi:tetratricopeptide (TPR) repeat protein
VLTNANQPAFIDELIRSVALTYKWDNYVPVYKRMNIDLAGSTNISGRYRNGMDGLINVYSEGNRLFMKYVRADQPSELVRITDSTYVSGEDNNVFQFKLNPADGTFNMISVNSDGGPAEFNRPRMKGEEKIPFEFLLSDDFDEALKRYRVLQKEYPEDRAVNESNLNNQGYNLMNSGKLKLSLAVFKINMMLYPKSSNVYDSYAEACMKNGDRDQAIANYKKSLQLDPDNKNAEEKLAELLKKEIRK